MQTYRIPAINFPKLQAEIEKLNRKAVKLKTDPVVLTVLETVTKTEKNELVGFEYQQTIHICSVTGDAPKLSGWTLVAVLEPVGNKENLVREIPGQDCPAKYRSADMSCDHCGETRRRNSVFVLKNENNEFKQVGKNCLADFLGHKNPESLLSRAEYIFTFERVISESQDWGPKEQLAVPTTNFAITSAVVIRKLGWLPKSKAGEYEKSTADIVWEICAHSEDSRVQSFVRENGIYAEECDLTKALNAIEWAEQLDSSAANTYLYDLGVCCRQNFVDFRRKGFVASVIQAHQRYLGDLQKNESDAKISNFVGEPKKRQQFENLSVQMVVPYMSGVYNKTLVKFSDPDGNIVIWRASGSPDWVEIGKTFTVRATVKEDGHTQYKGVNQTEVSRVETVSLD